MQVVWDRAGRLENARLVLTLLLVDAPRGCVGNRRVSARDCRREQQHIEGFPKVNIRTVSRLVGDKKIYALRRRPRKKKMFSHMKEKKKTVKRPTSFACFITRLADPISPRTHTHTLKMT